MSEHCPDHSAHERAINVHDERLNAHGDEIDSMRECIARLTAIQEADQRWREEADARIAALEMKPARRWDSVVDKLIIAAVGAAFGALLGGYVNM